MCQLTYSNLHDPYLNSLMVYFLSTIGSVKHDDGCGFITCENKIWKSATEAGKISNLGEILDHNIRDERPIPFHIRMATWGIEVTKENAHPFVGKYFILMHNGTLLPRDGEEPKDKKKDSDSLKFLNALDEEKDKNPEAKFDEIFNKAMDNFAGKFAFIIREKETNIDYIIRGKTAELWKTDITVDGKFKGYAINTSKVTMEDALYQFSNVATFMTSQDKTKKYEYSTPVLLEEETIFIADKKDIKEIGVAKEFTPVKKKTETAITPHNRSNYDYGEGLVPKTSNSDIGNIIRMAVKIYDFLSDHSLGLLDLQRMFKLMGGLSLLEATKEDFEMFVDYMVPKISATKALRMQVKSILNGKYFPTEVYEKYQLEYPWTVNDGKKILDSLKEWKA